MLHLASGPTQKQGRTPLETPPRPGPAHRPAGASSAGDVLFVFFFPSTADPGFPFLLGPVSVGREVRGVPRVEFMARDRPAMHLQLGRCDPNGTRGCGCQELLLLPGSVGCRDGRLLLTIPCNVLLLLEVELLVGHVGRGHRLLGLRRGGVGDP